MAGSLRRLSPSSLLLRVVMILGPVVALACGALAGHRPSVTAFVVATVLSTAYAARPDAWTGTVVMLGVVLWWAQAFDDALPASVLPAVVALIAAHLAGLLADHGPARMPLGADVAVLWTRRGALVALPAAALWVPARLLDGTSAPGVWVAAAGFGTLAAAAVAVVLGRTRQP